MNVIEKHDNGLTLIELKSLVQPNEPAKLNEAELENWNQLIKDKFGGAPRYAVFYLDYGIRFAKWENGALHFYNSPAPEAQYLQLARIFNAERELKIWRDDIGFRHRLRIDEKGAGSFAIEAEQNLWGTHAELLPNGWTRLWEDRGTELFLPLKVDEIKFKDEQGKEHKYDGQLVCLKTHNYIDETGNGQATYVDCRFADIRARTRKEIFGKG
jgi:CRISPR-associated protein (TIGR03984 family)